MERPRAYMNGVFRIITWIYVMVLFGIGCFTCYLAYNWTKSEKISQIDRVMIDINNAYERSTEEFWRFYMPIFEDKEGIYLVLQEYFNQANESSLSPLDKRNLHSALKRIMGIDDHIKWIGVYSGKNKENYLLFSGKNVLTNMSADFPFIDDMENKGSGMEIYESRIVEGMGERMRCFALCGGTAEDMAGGKIIIGYATEELKSSYIGVEGSEEWRFFLVNENGIIYDSKGLYEYDLHENMQDGIRKNEKGDYVYIRKLSKNTGRYEVFAEILYKEMVFSNHILTPWIALIVIIFILLSMFLYIKAGRTIMKKLAVIKYGLSQIGNTHLDYRIQVSGKPKDEFDDISCSINQVAERLQDNLDRIYLAKLKQKEAELSELQAKFDPHFLYNTLEIVRGRVLDKGDDETANVIVKITQIFRSFVGNDNFVRIKDEMEFCNLYLSLLKYRYDDVSIIYDIESEILEYGIIRNLLQPILENYFVHGFEVEKLDNRLEIRGVSKGNYIQFLIKDNGMGISKERIGELMNHLDTMKTDEGGSYGLKNINKRIKLYYGPECGLTIASNEEGGVDVGVLIPKLTYEEHINRVNKTLEFEIKN